MIGWIILGAVVILFGSVVFIGAPYVPSQRKYVRRALTLLYPLSKKDVLVDLGCGDGVVLRIARSLGAKAVGYEINPVLVLISRLLSWRDSGVAVRTANFWRASLPNNTTVIYAFAVSRDGRKLVKKMQRESDRLGRDLTLLCHASPLPGVVATKSLDAYSLYVFRPLQSGKAQV